MSDEQEISGSRKYWRDREEEALQHYITNEKEYDRQIEQIYRDMLDSVQSEINGFYGRYASKEGITIAEAKKRVTQLDIEVYERKAKRYVRDKDFSAEANEEMRLYNLTMKINRLEMLKANIGLELIKGHDELEKYLESILQGRTMEELERQAGILGKTVRNNAKLAHTIPNASFHNATFSQRIWANQDLLKSEISKLLQSGMIQGKNPRVLARELKKTFNTSTYNTERLIRTELARVQTDAQKRSFERNGFAEYEFIANSGCCDICKANDGKHFKVANMMPGENAAPMHPHCRCSCAAWEDSKEYDAWLDYLEKGGTTEEWNATGKAAWLQGKTTPKPKAKRSTKKKEPPTAPKAAGQLDVANFPDAFGKGTERKNTQKFVDFVNSFKGANADTISLYNSMRRLESIVSNGIPFKIGHGKNHAIRSRMTYSGDLVDAQIVIPKLSGDNIAGQVTTMLHEEMHLMDMYCRTDKKKAGGWFSTTRPKLREIFSSRNTDMSDEVAALFKSSHAAYEQTRAAVGEDYKKKRAALREAYFPNNESVWSDLAKYRRFEKEDKKLLKWYQEELDYQCRNTMDGVNSLEDIYDALSYGQFRDNGTVKYGHGSKYYRSADARAEETLANYGALSVSHPELIEMLRRDKPELVAELEATVKAMLEMAGE